MRRWLNAIPVLWAAILLAAILAPSARADGCYIPERAVATPPPIPVQQALLAWDETAKHETLVIESSLDAKSQSLGWILPLPAEPDSIREASPGLLKTLDACFQPTIRHDFSLLHGGVQVGLLFGGILVAFFGFFSRPAEWSRTSCVFFIVMWLVSMAYAVALLMPASAHLGERAVAGVELRQSAIVGHYDIAVLKADSAAALDKWLEQNGLAAMPERGRRIVESYIRDGWRFASVRLRLAEKGVQTPHPLAVTFPAKAAVYPMRLTVLSGQPLWLDLFVVGPERADAPVLKRWFSGKLLMAAAGKKAETAPSLGSQDGCRCGHPEFLKLVHDGCTLTRLSGEVSPGRMMRDFPIAWDGGAECRATLFSWRGANELTLLLVCGAALLFLVVLVLGRVKAEWLAEPGGRWRYFRKIVLTGLGAIVAAGLLLRLCLPMVHAKPVSFIERTMQWAAPIRAAREAAQVVSDLPEGADTAALRTRLQAEFARWVYRPQEEASPGNYTIGLSADGRPQVTVYDEHGCPMVFTAQAKADGNEEAAGEKR